MSGTNRTGSIHIWLGCVSLYLSVYHDHMVCSAALTAGLICCRRGKSRRRERSSVQKSVSISVGRLPAIIIIIIVAWLYCTWKQSQYIYCSMRSFDDECRAQTIHLSAAVCSARLVASHFFLGMTIIALSLSFAARHTAENYSNCTADKLFLTLAYYYMYRLIKYLLNCWISFWNMPIQNFSLNKF